MNNEQSVTLLRQNKRKQVDALNTIGFASVTANTRASLFADYIKWSGGLLDVRVAIVRITDGEKFYLTIQEWESLTNANKALFVKQGVRIRAQQLDFMLAANALGTFAWGSNKDVTTLTNYSQTGASSVFNEALDALTLTQRINTYYGTATANNVTGAPAAKAALNYKAFSQATDGVDDDLNWCLPLPKHCMVLYRHIAAINDVLRRAWSSDNIITTSTLWTCIECSAANAWAYIMSYGGIYDTTKVSALTVRPIALFNT